MVEQYHKTEQECAFQTALTHVHYSETSNLCKWYYHFCFKENNGSAVS